MSCDGISYIEDKAKMKALILPTTVLTKTSITIVVLQIILTGGNSVFGFSFSNHVNNFHSTGSQHRCSIAKLYFPAKTIPYNNHRVLGLEDADSYYPPDDEDEHQTNQTPTSGATNANPNNHAGHDYILETNSDPNLRENCRLTEEQIHVLIAKRLHCKKTHNFADADKIMTALNANGIYLQDKSRKYRVDGENHFGRKQRYVRRGSGRGLAPEELAEIADVVEERARHKRMREYHVSDKLTDALKERYGVRVNDKKREWSIGVASKDNDGATTDGNDNYYIPTPLANKDHPTHTMSDEVKEVIRNRLHDRVTARKNKKYKDADRIRDELMGEYSILIDDRNKEWKVVDEFDDDGEDLFVKEAKLSQRSAFAQK